MSKSNSQVSTLDDSGTTAAPERSTTVAAEVVDMTKGGSSELSGKKEIVTIHSTEGEGGNDAVFISHDGYSYLVPRDKPHVLPTEVAQILRDARVTQYKTLPGGGVQEEFRPRFAFSSQPA